MNEEKPVFVFYQGKWRRYRWTRELLRITCLGDVIPDLESPLADDPAAAHLHTNPGAPADIVSDAEPSASAWSELPQVAALGTETIRFSDPFE